MNPFDRDPDWGWRDDWSNDDHDNFVILAQICDSLTELRSYFPHKPACEVIEKAKRMGILDWLTWGSDAQV